MISQIQIFESTTSGTTVAKRAAKSKSITSTRPRQEQMVVIITSNKKIKSNLIKNNYYNKVNSTMININNKNNKIKIKRDHDQVQH
jgi:hypothetical protein